MRILHILNDVTSLGNGIVNTAVDLAVEQARQGHDVTIASADGGYRELLIRSGVHHVALDQSRKPAVLFKALRTLHRILRHSQPDVIHAHMRTGLILSWILTRVNRVPIVAHLHNIHDRESMLMGLADRVIAVSHSVAQSLAKHGIPPRKIRVALNRTLGSPRQLDATSSPIAPILRPSIVTVCGMSHRKGIVELIAAFEAVAAIHPLAQLYLVGDGPERVSYQTMARHSPYCNRIHFEGYQRNPQQYMRAADIFVLASRRESFGLVLIEARQTGCAIVATDVDGIAEALDVGHAGILVPPRNPQALASAIDMLLENEAERDIWKKRARIGIDAFHISRMAKEMDVIYRELATPRDAKFSVKAGVGS